MTTTKTCPRCQRPLEIPQPTPEQIRCDQCGVVPRPEVGGAWRVTQMCDHLDIRAKQEEDGDLDL